LNLRLGASLLVAEDYADPAVQATFERCRELAERADALPPLLVALAGLHTYHAARAELADTGRIVPRILELAERLPLPQAIVVAHTCAAWSEWSRGALAAACAHGEWAIAANLTEPMTFPSAFDLVGYAFGTTAFATMARGDLAAARALSAQGRAWSDHTGRPVDHATSLALAALLHAFMNEPAAAGAYAAQSVAVAEEPEPIVHAGAGERVMALEAEVQQLRSRLTIMRDEQRSALEAILRELNDLTERVRAQIEA